MDTKFGENFTIPWKLLAFILLFGSQQVLCHSLVFKKVASVPDASFRGLSVVDDSIAWVSGSKGYIGKSINGGKDWKFNQIESFENYDFRSLYAFDSRTAVVANAGSPAIIMRTTDGGISWKLVYKNDDTAAFFDGLDFINENGIAYGDPLTGRMMILRTADSGKTWHVLPKSSCPVMSPGEASFAASGTCIRCLNNGKLIIATGGTVSRLLIAAKKYKWKSVKTPIIQGLSTTGIFSFDFINGKKGIIVGGDYKRDSLKKDHIFYTNDGGKTWKAPLIPSRGYRECVAFLNSDAVITTGPSGTDISVDGGLNWKPFSDEKGFHVIRKSRKGGLLIMAGAGKICVANFRDVY